MTWKQRASISLLLLGHFACVAFCTPVVLNSPFLAFVLAGIVTGQAILIAVWTIYSAQARLFRFTSGGLLAASLWLELMTAFHFSDPNESPMAVGLVIATHLVAAIAAACVPLWLARRIGKWQIRPPGDDGAPQQFTLRYSLILMGLVCILLALGRVVLSPTDNDLGEAAPEVPDFLFAAAIGAAVFVFVCTLIVLAGLSAFFLNDEFDIALMLVGVPVYAFAVTLVLWTAFLLILHGAGSDAPIALFAFNIGQFATIAITMSWLRRSGFILNLGQNGTTPGDAGDEPDGPSADLTTPGLPPLHPLSHL